MLTRLRFAAVVAVAATITVGLFGCSRNHADRDSAALLAGPDVVSFKVEGMACRNCAKEIAHELMEVPGVKAAAIDFDSATARVALDPAAPASMDSLHAAVETWRKEHFGLEEDPNCLDPKKRAEIKKGS